MLSIVDTYADGHVSVPVERSRHNSMMTAFDVSGCFQGTYVGLQDEYNAAQGATLSHVRCPSNATSMTACSPTLVNACSQCKPARLTQFAKGPRRREPCQLSSSSRARAHWPRRHAYPGATNKSINAGIPRTRSLIQLCFSSPDQGAETSAMVTCSVRRCSRRSELSRHQAMRGFKPRPDVHLARVIPGLLGSREVV